MRPSLTVAALAICLAGCARTASLVPLNEEAAKLGVTTIDAVKRRGVSTAIGVASV